MKKAKVVLAQPAAGAPRALSPRLLAQPRQPLSRAPGSVRGAGEEAAYRARLRYQDLLQDYRELVKETEAKKRWLHMAKLKKWRLLAEVKFLRKRYKSMSANPSQTIVCRLKNPVMPSPTLRADAWADDMEHRAIGTIGSSSRSQPALVGAIGSSSRSQPALVGAIGSSSKSQPVQRRQLGPPIARPVIDLNEACEPSHEQMEMDGYHGYQQQLAIDNPKMHPLDGDGAAGPSGVRMPAFWDVQNPAGRAEKRKISWQDQLALRV